MYVGAPASPPVPMAVRSLAGFQRISLAPGESKHLTIHVAQRAFQYWSVDTHDWATAWGTRTFSVGSSSRDIRLSSIDAPLKPAAEEVLDLLALVQGVGPGKSLNNKVLEIQADIAANQTANGLRRHRRLQERGQSSDGQEDPDGHGRRNTARGRPGRRGRRLLNGSCLACTERVSRLLSGPDGSTRLTAA